MPAVAILGPRQDGKTTLALEIARQQASLYLDLQFEADRARLNDPAAYLTEHSDKLVVLDEIHRVPELFSTLRAVIEINRRAGRRHSQFVILGSATPELPHQSGESLADRLAYIELHGIDILEAIGIPSDSGSKTTQSVGLPLRSLWLRGGFPDS